MKIYIVYHRLTASNSYFKTLKKAKKFIKDWYEEVCDCCGECQTFKDWKRDEGFEITVENVK